MLIRAAHHSRARAGFVILAVLVVITLLSLAAYKYSDSMLAEARASDRVLKTTEARTLADSGVYYAAAVLSTPDSITAVLDDNPYDNASVFRGHALGEAPAGRRQGRFSLVGVDYAAGANNGAYPKRFGVTDESGKININALMQLDPSGNIALNSLMKLPNMTEEIANSIIDWIDPDETARNGGAESQYYSALTPGYRCKNGPLDSLEELLLVKGVTPDLLFGTDRNRNGESDSGDGTDAAFDAGWAPYLTVYSRERNVDSTGQARININATQITNLYSQLEPAVGQEMAAFVLAYRLYDVQTSGGSGSGGQSGGQSGNQSGGQSGNQSGGQSGGGQSRGQGGSTGGGQSGGGGQSSGGSQGGGGGATVVSTNYSQLATQVQSASNDFFGGRPKRSIPSIFGLINASVSVPGQQGQPSVTYRSPLADQSKLVDLLPKMLDKTTTQSAQQLPGRININTASDVVLRCLPGLTDVEINQVIDRRPAPGSLSSSDPTFSTPAWLITQAGLRPETAQTLERYITTRTQVYRVQSVGYFDGGGPTVRIEAVIDGNLGKPRILYYRDLTELGRAFDSYIRD